MDLITVSHTPALSNVGEEIVLHISPSGFLRLDGGGFTPAALMFDRTNVTPNRYISSHILRHYMSVCLPPLLCSEPTWTLQCCSEEDLQGP